VIVDELRPGLVLGAEGDLRLLLGIEIQPEQFLVAADPRGVDDELAVGRIARRPIAERNRRSGW
jgi:hypothetical protein